MRHLLISTLLCILLTPILAHTTQSLSQPRQAEVTDLSTSPGSVLDWENRLLADAPKVRADAEASLAKGAQRSLPLLRRLLSRENPDLEMAVFEVIRRIGPAAIPLLVELLRDTCCPWAIC
jgi:hypothetical protein